MEAVLEMQHGVLVEWRLMSLSWRRMKSRTVLLLIFGRGMPVLQRTGSSTNTRCWILSYCFVILSLSELD